MLKGGKILVTGVTGMAPMPVAEYLARDNEVWGVARFADAETRRRLEAKGIIARPVDLLSGDLSSLPQDFTHLVLCAYGRFGSGEFNQAVQVNGLFTGRIMQHCRRAEAAILFSSGSIYSTGGKDGYHPFKETDDIGGAFPPWAPTAAVAKVSQEAVARFCAEAYGIPTTIARLNIVFGPFYGMPFMDAEAVVSGREIVSFADPYPANVIHSDDMCDQIEAMFDAASVPARVVNWCGDDVVTRHEWIERAAQLAGKPARIKLAPAPGAPAGSVLDATLRRSVAGPARRAFWAEFDAMFRQKYGL